MTYFACLKVFLIWFTFSPTHLSQEAQQSFNLVCFILNSFKFPVVIHLLPSDSHPWKQQQQQNPVFGIVFSDTIELSGRGLLHSYGGS